MNESTPPQGTPGQWDDLQVWKVAPEIPVRFQSEVWQKIAARQAEPSLWRKLADWATRLAARPQFATIVILAAGLAGGSLAQVKVHQANARSFKALESQYIASVDPYAHLAIEGGAQ